MDVLSPGQVAQIAHGPMFIGFSLNLILFGVMTVQTYLYFSIYKQDSPWLKLYVLLLYILDTFNTVFDFVYIYKCLVEHYGEVAYLAKATWVFATDPALTGIIATLVQLFFAWRIKLLTGSLWLSGIVVLLGFLGMAGALATAIEVGSIHPYFVDFQEFKSVVILWLASECLCDILITTILVIHLKAKKTGFSATDDIVDRIIRMTVQTGLVTSICALIDLVTFLALPHNGVHLIFNLPLCKLYTNSLISSLNAREPPRPTGTNETTSHSSHQSGLMKRHSSARASAYPVIESGNRTSVFARARSPRLRTDGLDIEMDSKRQKFTDYSSPSIASGGSAV